MLGLENAHRIGADLYGGELEDLEKTFGDDVFISPEEPIYESYPGFTRITVNRDRLTEIETKLKELNEMYRSRNEPTKTWAERMKVCMSSCRVKRS